MLSGLNRQVGNFLAKLRACLRHFLLNATLGLRDDIACARLGVELDVATHVLAHLGRLGDGVLCIAARLLEQRLDTLLRLGQVAAWPSPRSLLHRE